MQSTSSIELFCGAGGLALGLQQAGFSHKALYELNKDCCTNIKANIEQGCPLVRDWQIFQNDVRNNTYDEYVGKISMISGGPPCQPFSIGGKGQAHNDARDMFPEAVRAVREILPDVFIFENVRGLLRESFKEYFDYILMQLKFPSITKQPEQTWQEHAQQLKKHCFTSNNAMPEYNVSYKLVNSADYGVPQVRYRVLIVGWRQDLNIDWQFPEPTHSKESLLYSKWISGSYWTKHNLPKPKDVPISEKALKKVKTLVESKGHNLLPWITTRDVIGDLPDPRDNYQEELDNHIFKDGAKIYIGHSGSCLDEPSKTIKAGAHGVPGGENMIVLDDGSVRYFTVRESARIQTFPDNYKFYSSWTESMRQIGNAVPVHLAKIIGQSILASLNRGIHG